MGDSGESLRARLRARWPGGAPGAVAAVFVAAALIVGGIGGVAHATTPAPVAAEDDIIVDPIGAPADAPLASAEPLAHTEASQTAVTTTWAAPAPRRSSGGGGGGGGGASGVLGHTNAARAANGLAGLSWNGTLASRSCTWAQHLAAADGDLAHSSDSSGFSWWGENVAYGYGSAAAVVDGWMNSPGHRANILRPQFTLMGSCSATSSSGRMYWVQQFGA
jgi:uncharacterized protein YkwD